MPRKGQLALIAAHLNAGIIIQNLLDSRSGRSSRLFQSRALRTLPAEQCPEGVSVARAHGVVDHEVEGGVDVGEDVEDPQTRHEKVVVTSSRVHLWHER